MAVLNDEQIMLRDMAREWTQNESPVTEWRKVRSGGDERAFDPAAYQTMAEMGWTGVIVPEEHGGSDFGWMSAGLVIEELGKTLTASPIVSSTLAAAAIILAGSDEQKAKWLPRLASGEAIGTLAIDDNPRHDGKVDGTKASGGKLNGTKPFVHEAHGADIFIAATDGGLYVVEKGEGVSLSTRKLADSRSHAAVTFTDAPGDRLANGPDDVLDQLLDRARILTACEMLGMAQAVFDTTLDYLKQRVQFNQVLATFQALQHRMADLFGDIAMMRSAVEGGLQALDAGFGIPRAACVAKVTANDTMHKVSREGLQLHGGIGMTDEYDVGFYLKRARTLEADWGSSAMLRNRFAEIGKY